MLLPSLMNGNIFDNWMKEFPAGIANRENFFRNASAGEIMKTDVKETETGYDVEIDLPGFKKEEVTAKLDDGYLVISACRSKNSDEKDEEGKYIRRERYTGSGCEEAAFSETYTSTTSLLRCTRSSLRL